MTGENHLALASTTNPTQQALFEYDRLVRSIYKLKYLRVPQLERNIRRSLNRIESYIIFSLYRGLTLSGTKTHVKRF